METTIFILNASTLTLDFSNMINPFILLNQDNLPYYGTMQLNDNWCHFHNEWLGNRLISQNLTEVVMVKKHIFYLANHTPQNISTLWTVNINNVDELNMQRILIKFSSQFTDINVTGWSVLQSILFDIDPNNLNNEQNLNWGSNLNYEELVMILESFNLTPTDWIRFKNFNFRGNSLYDLVCACHDVINNASMNSTFEGINVNNINFQHFIISLPPIVTNSLLIFVGAPLMLVSASLAGPVFINLFT